MVSEYFAFGQLIQQPQAEVQNISLWLADPLSLGSGYFPSLADPYGMVSECSALVG